MARLNWSDAQSVVVEGPIDEHTEFTELETCPSPSVTISFRNVLFANSIGLRKWSLALTAFKGKVILVNVPCHMSSQFGFSPHLLANKARVETFLAPYYCNQCRREMEILLKLGTDVQPGVECLDEAPAKSCPGCKSPLEFAQDPETFFAFLSLISP